MLPEGRGPARGSRSSAWLCALAGLAALAGWIARFDFVADDAYISFRYARHLAEGHGLRFNLGESPPVEGYSNLAWVLWCSVAELARWDVTLWARAGSACCAAASVLLVLRAGWRAASPLAGGLAALLLGAQPGFGLWASGGLETAAFALAVLALASALSARTVSARAGGLRAAGCAAATLAVLALRTDGVPWVLATLAAWMLAQAEPWPARLRAARPVLAALLAGAAALLAFRLAYHRDWISSTARVKGGLSGLRLERGLLYDASQLLAQPALLVLLALAAWGALAAAGGARAAARAGLALFGFALAYAAAVGGDFMAFGRLLVPALAPLALGAGASLASLLARGARARASALAASVLCLALALGAGFDRVPVPAAWRARLHFRWNTPDWQSELAMWRSMRERAEQWALEGRALALYTRPGESILGTAIGAMSYPNELVVLDLFGLVSPEVSRQPLPIRRMSPGHDRFVSPEFFFDRRPTYYGAAIVPAGAPASAGLGFELAGSDLSRVIGIERHPLPENAGFPSGLELRLFRMRW